MQFLGRFAVFHWAAFVRAVRYNLFVPSETKRISVSIPPLVSRKSFFSFYCLVGFAASQQPMDCVHGYARFNPFGISRNLLTPFSKPYPLISPNQSQSPPSPCREGPRVRLLRFNLQVLPPLGRGNEGEAPTSHQNPPQSFPLTDGSGT